jgi:hypothetical protein
MYKVALVLLMFLIVIAANNIYATGFVVGGESQASFLPMIFVVFFFVIAAYIILRGVQKNN